jgi:serine/threonine protein kinase
MHTIHSDEYPDSRSIGPEDFEGLGILGKGSFGEVFLVRDLRNSRIYAMKVLRKDKVLGSNIVRYAFTERNIMSGISHPFIVKLQYAFQTKEKLAFVMEYCSGGDLSYYIHKDGTFTEERARIYICEILLALEELHNNGIIFRDLKPENVVLDEEGHCKLTDFGLSKEGVRDGMLLRSFCGSIAYLAPEMIKRQGHCKSVDWYLLGVVLYEMLHGIPPYYSQNRDQLFHNIVRAKLQIGKHVSDRSAHLISKLLLRNPSKRLGASRRDAEEIKEHPFFEGVNWDAVKNRQLKPPAPSYMNKRLKKVSKVRMFGVYDKCDKGVRLEGWSFIKS